MMRGPVGAAHPMPGCSMRPHRDSSTAASAGHRSCPWPTRPTHQVTYQPPVHDAPANKLHTAPCGHGCSYASAGQRPHPLADDCPLDIKSFANEGGPTIVFSIACKDPNKASRRINNLNTDVHMSLMTRDVPVSTTMGRLTRRGAGQDSARGATASESAPPSASSSAPKAGPAAACSAALLRPSCTAARAPPACGHDSERMWICARGAVNVPRCEHVAERAHERGVSKSKFCWRRAASIEK